MTMRDDLRIRIADLPTGGLALARVEEFSPEALEQLRDALDTGKAARLEALVRSLGNGLSAHHANIIGPCLVCAKANRDA